MLTATIALALSIATGQKLPFDVRVMDTGLLKFESVQRELKLSSDQIAHIDQAEKDYRAEQSRNHKWDSDKENEVIARYLSNDQLKRLREISLQKAGPIVLIVDFVDTRLGMSEERHKKILAAFNEAINEAIEPMTQEISSMVDEEMQSAGNDPDEIKKHSKKISERAEEISSSIDHKGIVSNAAKKIFNSLTPSERQAWKDIQGTPFPVDQLKGKDDED
jgi:hypothetical protein